MSLQRLFYRVICNISIETDTGNQTAFVPQHLVCNTVFLLRATKSKHLENQNASKDLVWYHLIFSLVSLKSPWNTFALPLNLIQILLSLALLSVVNKALLLVVRKMLKAFCSSHSLQRGHPIRSRLKCTILCKGVNEDPEMLLFCTGVPNILCCGVQLIRDGVQQ